jgi:hypothetical protein
MLQQQQQQMQAAGGSGLQPPHMYPSMDLEQDTRSSEEVLISLLLVQSLHRYALSVAVYASSIYTAASALRPAAAARKLCSERSYAHWRKHASN